ncbi:CDP-diacylglycerol--inositol 3-phosphatidyltransferase [Nematocida displodere]|uniref:CDP-diacylglycerol--inositol 3-phosphatidyltransferase n=1 Tax=Nematocida displodere TaxID=1805483 RepID=A0A177EIK2_9MICR|nr:CDP-diacylglycerol--inositol 3-phosphatidyltransferase [Nematocida displodere]
MKEAGRVQEQRGVPKSVFMYLPNIVGYVRLGLLLASLAAPVRVFVCLYAVSYLLDALDGHLARGLGQVSQLGGILDMSLDRASSTVLAMQVVREHPRLFPLCGAVVVLDLVAHMFCVVNGALTKTSHKAQKVSADRSLVDVTLSVYYNKGVLFATCLLTELFLINVLCPFSVVAGLVMLPVFLFKQVTNVLQLWKAAHSLSTI